MWPDHHPHPRPLPLPGYPHPFALDVFDDEDGHSLCDCPDPCTCDYYYPEYPYYTYQPPYNYNYSAYDAYPQYSSAPSPSPAASPAPARPPPLSRVQPSPSHSPSPPVSSPRAPATAHPTPHHHPHPRARARAPSHPPQPRGARLDERDAPKPMHVRHYSTGSIGREVMLVPALHDLQQRRQERSRSGSGNVHGNATSARVDHDPREGKQRRGSGSGSTISHSRNGSTASAASVSSAASSDSGSAATTFPSIAPAVRAPSPSKRVTFAEPPKPERGRRPSRNTPPAHSDSSPTPTPASILRKPTALRYAACPLAAGVPLTDLRAFPTTPGALGAQSAVLASLLRDLRALRTWEAWCAELGAKLATHKREEGRLRGALDGVVPLHRLREWGGWVDAQLAAPSPVVSRDHLREEKEYVAFLAGLADEVGNAADLRARCEGEIARLRRTRR